METKHTPLPWHIGMRPGPMVYGPKGGQVADCRDMLPDHETRANALLIVRAVNEHATLTAQVAQLRAIILESVPHLPTVYDLNSVLEGTTLLDRARAALSATEPGK